MANHIPNPFVLPGLGQGGDAGQNPLLASMEMMRQAWQGLASSGALSSMAAPMSLDDLDRRIADLHTVENWLRMNLSMLTSTIQGLEVQRATIATLKSFAVSPNHADRSGPSPLEVVLGIKPAASPSGHGSAFGRPAGDAPASSGAAPASHQPGRSDAASGAVGGDTSQQPDRAVTEDAKADSDQTSSGVDIPAVAAGWWNMLQQQFDTLAAATAATLQSAEAMKSPSAQPAAPSTPKPASADSSFKQAAPKPRTSKSAAKSAAKSAPRKRAAAKKAPQ